MTTITRRTALAASVTLPLLPVSAFAAPAKSRWTETEAQTASNFINTLVLHTGYPSEPVPQLVAYLAAEVRRSGFVAPIRSMELGVEMVGLNPELGGRPEHEAAVLAEAQS